ncbi:unnamed protein product, partial [Medioppia subpectinata]
MGGGMHPRRQRGSRLMALSQVSLTSVEQAHPRDGHLMDAPIEEVDRYPILAPIRTSGLPTGGLPATPAARHMRSIDEGEWQQWAQTQRADEWHFPTAAQSGEWDAPHTQYTPQATNMDDMYIGDLSRFPQTPYPSSGLSMSLFGESADSASSDELSPVASPTPSSVHSSHESYVMGAQQSQESPVMAQTVGQSSGLATGGAQFIPAIPLATPRDRLALNFRQMGAGEMPEGSISGTSAEIYVNSSGEELASDMEEDDQNMALNAKTQMDLQTLWDKGFEINFSQTGKLGSGVQGVAYRGVYNQRIYGLSTTEGSRLKGVVAGRGFAAKYVQFSQYADYSLRIDHEIEKQILKALKHPNCVSLKIAINLGKKRYIINNKDPNIKPIVSYDRMFLAMDLAESSLYDFGQAGRITQRLAIKFAQEMCAGMNYMHSQSILHLDPTYGNVLLFRDDQNAGDFVAKWSDFDTGVFRSLYQRWGIWIEDNEFEHYRRNDLERLARLINDMALFAPVLTQLAHQITNSADSLQQIVDNFDHYSTRSHGDKYLVRLDWVRYAEFTPNTTGDGSVGLIYPYLPGKTDPKRVRRWVRDTMSYLRDHWVSPNAGKLGIGLMSLYLLFDEKVD